MEGTGQAAVVWMIVGYAGQTGGFAQLAQLVAEEREPMTDWMPSRDRGLEVDTPMFGALGWLCGLEEACFDSGLSELLNVRLRQPANDGCIGHFGRGFLGGGDPPDTRQLVLARGREFGRESECELDLVATARPCTEVQKSQQGTGRGVVMRRDRGEAREAVGAGTFECLDRECCANAVSVEIVCDFDRDVGDIWLIGQLDVARDSDE